MSPLLSVVSSPTSQLRKPRRQEKMTCRNGIVYQFPLSRHNGTRPPCTSWPPKLRTLHGSPFPRGTRQGSSSFPSPSPFLAFGRGPNKAGLVEREDSWPSLWLLPISVRFRVSYLRHLDHCDNATFPPWLVGSFVRQHVPYIIRRVSTDSKTGH
jgi:hypothetical protein